MKEFKAIYHAVQIIVAVFIKFISAEAIALESPSLSRIKRKF